MSVLGDHFVKIDGVRIHYIEQGKGDPVLLLHGSSFNSRTWEETGTLAAIANSGFRAISVDLPGKGLSEKGNFSEDMADFIERLSDILALDNPILLGASLGGFVALSFAISHPKSVRGLILAGAAFNLIEKQDSLRKLKPIPSLLIWGSEDA